MAKSTQQAAAAGATSDEVEAAFYDALRAADLEKLMACWADEDDIICVHPGGPRLVGPGAIRAVFEAMFANGSIQAWPEAVCKIETLGSRVHNVRERIEVLTSEGPRLASVIATNVYHKTAQGWRMVLHHASPGTAHEAPETGETSHVLH